MKSYKGKIYGILADNKIGIDLEEPESENKDRNNSSHQEEI